MNSRNKEMLVNSLIAFVIGLVGGALIVAWVIILQNY